MIDKVGNVILDYTFYNGSDEYSDGDIEKELLSIVQQKEKSVIQVLSEDSRWPILYHLSPVRQNILEWYDFDKNASVLEIGAGCGAVTGVLCKNVKEVTCIELSKQRSLINAYRNEAYNNLRLIVGNFNDVELKEKFDYITLIGVLEYASYYTASNSPFQSFLSNMRRYLKPNGKILIAIENKFGLKYWAGCTEDHTGNYFDGLEGYQSSKVRTFSKSELEKLLYDSGYHSFNFYYPFPDYKFPKQIFSDDYLPKPDDINAGVDTYDNDRLVLFNETATYKNILDSNEFPFFSNSFFVEVFNNQQEEQT